MTDRIDAEVQPINDTPETWAKVPLDDATKIFETLMFNPEEIRADEKLARFHLNC